MKSYIKIFGPPTLTVIKALEKIAVEMPEVCIMNQTFVKGMTPTIAKDIGLIPTSKLLSMPDPWTTESRSQWTTESVYNYFSSSGIPVSYERCINIISKSSETLGEYNFFFEWSKKPSISQMEELIEKIDKELISLGCLYTITNL